MKKRILVVALAVVMALTMSFGFSACGEEDGGEASYAEVLLDFDEDMMPAPTKEVVYVAGSWHDMGVQYAEQATEALKLSLADGIGSAIAQFGSFEDALAETDEYVSLMEKKSPQLLELWQGMAEGLGVDYNAVLVGSIAFTADKKSCSTVAAWGEATKDGRMIVGANHDSNYYEMMYDPAVVAYPDKGNAFISSSSFSPSCALNEKGLVVTGSSGQSNAEGDRDYGVPTMTVLAVLATTCDNAEEAKDAVLDGVCTGSGDNVHVSDVKGNDYIIEHTARKDVVRKAGDYGEKDYTIATNDFLAEELQDSLYTGEEVWDDCIPRYKSEEKVITDNLGDVTLDVVNEAMSMTKFYMDGEWSEDVWDVKDYVGFWTPEHREAGTKCIARSIADPENMTMYLMRGCSDELASAAPDATGNFTKITLGKNPDEITFAAKQYAQMQIYLGARDISQSGGEKAARRDDLNTAKKALFKGNNFAIKASAAESKDEARTYLSKAATQYCKAQAYGQLAQNDPSKIKRDGANYEIW